VGDDHSVKVRSREATPGSQEVPMSLGREADGTSARNLANPCPDARRPAVPPEPDRAPPIAVALSGGGFRATLAGLGVLRFLAQAGLLGRVNRVSSVSGGSITNGLLAVNHDALQQRGFSGEAVDELLIRPLVDKISSRSFTTKLLANVWRALGSNTRTDVLAWAFDDWFFDGHLLRDLPTRVRFTFNAANATTGVRFGFERDVIGDYVLGWVPTAGTGLRVAQATAASAAVPGFFAAFTLDGVRFPCHGQQPVKLLDGGVYDNLALEVIDRLEPRQEAGRDRDPFVVALNAGGILRVGAYGRIPLIRDLSRANSLLYRQSSALRMRGMVERFEIWEDTPAGQRPPKFSRRGVLFGLASGLPEDKRNPEWESSRPEHPWWQPGDPDPTLELATVKTSFSRFAPQLCERLVHRGWWLTGATLSAYHPELLDIPALPTWEWP